MVPATAQPQVIGRYEVVGPLATGGMAEVLLARVRGPSGFERPIVIKRILPHFARMPEFRQMFLDEARIVANIRHRNVVAVHELGEFEDDLFLVMEYLEGESVSSLLRQLGKRREKLPLRLALHLVSDACAGLHAAHELTKPDGTPLEIVHRDVSPHNLFVLYDGHLKVIDFGIAKGKSSSSVTQAGHVKGKYGYMAPEQCRAQPLDRRADVFALGVVLYELTTGKRLFDRDNDLLVLHAVCEDPISRPSEVAPGYPPLLETICMRALARPRDERYGTAAALRRDLQALLREIPADESPEEELATLMQRLFQDRIAEKTSALRAIVGGKALASIPPGEPSLRSSPRERVGSGAGVPSDPGAGTPSANVQLPSRPSTFDEAPSAAPAPAASKALIATLAVLGAIALGAAAHVATSKDEPAPAPSSAAELATPAPASVNIEVTSTPSDAEIWIGGATRGRTPSRIDLPRGGAPTSIELRKEGFATAVESVVADADHRISVRLAEAPSAPSAAPQASTLPSSTAEAPRAKPVPRPKPAPKPTSTGFGRFD